MPFCANVQEFFKARPRLEFLSQRYMRFKRCLPSDATFLVPPDQNELSFFL